MNGAQELEGQMTHVLKLPTNVPVTERASWFYASAGETFGPFTEAALEALVRNGNVPSDILVRSEAAPHWKPYRETQFEFPVERQDAPQLTSGISTTVEARVEKKSARYETIHEAVCRECRGIFMTDAMLQHGDLVIDVGRWEVKVGVEEIQLAPKEFDLFWELLDYRGFVLMRD